MINERIRKSIHCIEDSISRYNVKGDKQHYTFNESLYYFALTDFSNYFCKSTFVKTVAKKLSFYYETSGVVSSLNDVLFVGSALIITQEKRDVFYNILEDRADSYISQLFETLPEVKSDSFTTPIISAIKSCLPHIVKIEDFCSLMLYLSKKYITVEEPQVLERARLKIDQYTAILYNESEQLFYSSYDSTKKEFFPATKFHLSASGYFLLGILNYLELLTVPDEKYNVLVKKLCERLAKLQKSNGYFNVTNSANLADDKKDGLASLLIAGVFFKAIRLNLISETYYDKAVRGFNSVVDGFKLKDGLLSMPNISNIGAIKRYLSINFRLTSTAYSDNESGLAALAFAAIEYSKCSDEKKLD